MNDKKTITIGRSHTNDCVFENQSVSGNHAILYLSSDLQSGIIKDLNSTNGTYINEGPKITSSVNVSLNDTIRFGSEKTSLKDILQKLNKTTVQKSSHNSITAPHKTIGKLPDNNIVLNYNDVSKKHAVIYKDSSGNVVVEDLGSTNGTYVNGMKITSCVLHSGDRLTITRNYPLEWEKIFRSERSPHSSNSKKIIATIASIAAALVIVFFGARLILDQSWDKQKIYKEYAQAVCLVYNTYGYKIYIDGKDVTPFICEILEMPANDYVHIDQEKFIPGPTTISGTAFFISEDGKLATNLHVARPWSYSKEKQIFEQLTNNILARLSYSNPMLSRSKVEVKGEVIGIGILQNGLPFTKTNLIECVEYKVPENNLEKDVAILQTSTHEVPTKVKRIFSLEDADTSEEAITEGNTLYTIGFPYGADVALNNRNEITNQIHEGEITQNRGEYEFGHDAETAGGASGSPIINEKGKLIGIHHAGLTGVTGAQGFNRAIKVKYIIDLMK